MQAPQRIQRLIEGNQLEQITPDSEKVVALWRKALASSRDSRKGLSNDADRLTVPQAELREVLLNVHERARFLPGRGDPLREWWENIVAS